MDASSWALWALVLCGVSVVLSAAVAIVAIIWAARVGNLANREVTQMCREALASGRVLPERLITPQESGPTPYERQQTHREELARDLEMTESGLGS